MFIKCLSERPINHIKCSFFYLRSNVNFLVKLFLSPTPIRLGYFLHCVLHSIFFKRERESAREWVRDRGEERKRILSHLHSMLSKELNARLNTSIVSEPWHHDLGHNRVRSLTDWAPTCPIPHSILKYPYCNNGFIRVIFIFVLSYKLYIPWRHKPNDIHHSIHIILPAAYEVTINVCWITNIYLNNIS